MGQIYVHKYTKRLLGYTHTREIDPSCVNHAPLPLSEAANGCKTFATPENCIKVVLNPGA